MAAPSYDKALADWQRVAATSDRAWEAYRKARERLARKRGTFAAEQGFIDASAAVGRAQDATDAKVEALRKACYYRADSELASEARARVPYRAPTLAEKTVRLEALLAVAMNGSV
jgi:hypothetical protein